MKGLGHSCSSAPSSVMAAHGDEPSVHSTADRRVSAGVASPVPADRHPAFGAPGSRTAHHRCGLCWKPAAVPTCPAQKRPRAHQFPEHRAFGRSNGRVALAWEYPCPTGMDLGAPRVSVDSATRKVISVWRLSPPLVACSELAIWGSANPDTLL